MNIIEKLELDNLNDRKRIQSYGEELFKALLEDVLSTAVFIESMPNITFMDDSIAKHIVRIELVERIAKKTWQEIKELF